MLKFCTYVWYLSQQSQRKTNCYLIHHVGSKTIKSGPPIEGVWPLVKTHIIEHIYIDILTFSLGKNSDHTQEQLVIYSHMWRRRRSLRLTTEFGTEVDSLTNVDFGIFWLLWIGTFDWLLERIFWVSLNERWPNIWVEIWALTKLVWPILTASQLWQFDRILWGSCRAEIQPLWPQLTKSKRGWNSACWTNLISWTKPWLFSLLWPSLTSKVVWSIWQCFD